LQSVSTARQFSLLAAWKCTGEVIVTLTFLGEDMYT
jgi:hypothetical protein